MLKRKLGGVVVKDYIDPFVYASCDAIGGTLEEVAEALKALPKKVKTLTIIDEGIQRFINSKEVGL